MFRIRMQVHVLQGVPSVQPIVSQCHRHAKDLHACLLLPANCLLLRGHLPMNGGTMRLLGHCGTMLSLRHDMLWSSVVTWVRLHRRLVRDALHADGLLGDLLVFHLASIGAVLLRGFCSFICVGIINCRAHDYSQSVTSFADGTRRQVCFPEARARDIAVENPLAFVHHEKSFAAMDHHIRMALHR